MHRQPVPTRATPSAASACTSGSRHPSGGLARLAVLTVSALAFVLLLAVIEFEVVSSMFPPGRQDYDASNDAKMFQQSQSYNKKAITLEDDDDRIRPAERQPEQPGSSGRRLQENATSGGKLRGSCDKSDGDATTDVIDKATISITTNGMGTYEPIVGQAKRHPRPIVVAGPSGVGKGTLINKLLDYYTPESDRESNINDDEATKGGDYFAFSVSHTTRGPRPGEVDGVHYHFSTRQAVQRGIDIGDFIEYAEVHGNLYGTSFDAVHSVAQSGRICILDIDIQGIKGVKDSTLDPYYIFVAPPSMELLEKRLRDRGTETEEAVRIRTANAAKEVEYGRQPGNFDAVVVNDDLDKAFLRLLDLLRQWYPHLPMIYRPSS